MSLSQSASDPSAHRSVFSGVFAPRVLGLRLGGIGSTFCVRLAYFNRMEGGFIEVEPLVSFIGGRIGRVDPPVVTVREIQQALKHYHLDQQLDQTGPSQTGRRISTAGQLPARVLEQLMRGLERGISERKTDASEHSPVVSERSAEQLRLQYADGIRSRLVALGRYHRRRGDYLGGSLHGDRSIGFGFTTGAHAGHKSKDPNEDALAIDRVGDMDVFVVADAHHGGRSSELAVRKILELLHLGFGDGLSEGTFRNGSADEYIGEFLLNAVMRSHQTILADLQNERSMTSLAVAVRHRRKLNWASVSDAFLFRKRGSQLVQINQDLGQGVRGPKLSIWLGDRYFQKRYVDTGVLDIGDDTFVLASDGFLKHPNHPPERLLASMPAKGAGGMALESETPGAAAPEADPASGTPEGGPHSAAPLVYNGDYTHRLAREFAQLGRDNTSFILVRGSEAQ